MNTNMKFASSIAFALVILLTIFPPSSGQDYQCSDTVDLFLLIDASTSVGTDDNWNTVLQFLEDTMGKLDVTFAASGMRVTFMTYAGEPLMEFANLYTALRKLQQAIDAAQRSPDDKNSDTAAAIDAVITSNIRNDRTAAQNVAMVITSAPSMDKDSTLTKAAEAIGAGIDIITIGITSNVDADEIQQMSSPPRVENQNYFQVDDYADLAGLTELVARGLCNRDVQPPETEAPTVPTTTKSTTSTTTTKVTPKESDPEMTSPTTMPTVEEGTEPTKTVPTLPPMKTVPAPQPTDDGSDSSDNDGTGSDMTTEQPPEESSNTKKIIIAVIIPLLLILLILVIAYLCYRYHKKKRSRGDKYMQAKMDPEQVTFG